MKQHDAKEDVLKSIKVWQKICEDNGEMPAVTAILTSYSPKSGIFIPDYAIYGQEELVSILIENLNRVIENMKKIAQQPVSLSEEQLKERIMNDILKDAKSQGKSTFHYKQGSKRRCTKDMIEIIDLS